jgi:hypothetical protein
VSRHSSREASPKQLSLEVRGFFPDSSRRWCRRLSSPIPAGPVSCPATPRRKCQSNSEVEPISFFLRSEPTLQAALWQRRSEPINALRSRCYERATGARHGQNTPRICCAATAMKRGHSTKKLVEAYALLQIRPTRAVYENKRHPLHQQQNDHHRAAQLNAAQRDNPT